MFRATQFHTCYQYKFSCPCQLTRPVANSLSLCTHCKNLRLATGLWYQDPTSSYVTECGQASSVSTLLCYNSQAISTFFFSPESSSCKVCSWQFVENNWIISWRGVGPAFGCSLQCSRHTEASEYEHWRKVADAISFDPPLRQRYPVHGVSTLPMLTVYKMARAISWCWSRSHAQSYRWSHACLRCPYPSPILKMLFQVGFFYSKFSSFISNILSMLLAIDWTKGHGPFKLRT